MGFTRDVWSFDDLDRVRRNVTNDHRFNPTKVIEVCLTSAPELQPHNLFRLVDNWTFNGRPLPPRPLLTWRRCFHPLSVPNFLRFIDSLQAFAKAKRKEVSYN